MNFSDSVSAYYSNYTNFSDRTSRSGYWWAFLWNIGISAIAYASIFLIGTAGLILYLLIALVHIIPAIAVSVRRLHDTSKSGWFILIGLIPIIGPVILLIAYLSPSSPFANDWGSPAERV